ncbi:peroxiredoxin family protein [Methylomicrobium sp. RS1]|uniref:peroxiredoxin family protein n=1 Tax=Candidatus Methylomicrobium oryzae TaxID=2802053 RepID=UPI00301A3982
MRLSKARLLFGLPMLVLAAWLIGAALSRMGGTAPDVVFTTITGKQIASHAWRGKPAIVTFWATDCPSCMLEIPHLIDLYRRFHPQGLEIVAVAMAYDPPSHVVAMTRDRQLPYDVALDLNSAHALAFGNVQFTPTTFLISPEGRIAEKSVGVFDYSAWQSRIAAMLNKG